MAVPVMPLERVKSHLRVEHSLDDADIALYAQAAVERTLAAVGLAGEFRPRVDTTFCRNVRFPVPVACITSVEKRQADGSWGLVSEDDYALSGSVESFHELTIDDDGEFRISWEAGYGEAVPSWFIVAALFLVGHYYENRSSVAIGVGVTAAEVPMAFEHLVSPHRRFWVV